MFKEQMGESKMMKINILDFFYSIYFNFRIFPIKVAYQLPILISHHTKCYGLYKNCIIIKDNIKRFMISLGVENGTYGECKSHLSYIYFGDQGLLELEGNITMCKGFTIRIFQNAKLKIGKGAWFNVGCTISCSEKIMIDKDLLAGWNVSIRDSDGHSVFTDQKCQIRVNKNKPVIIKSHVWLGADTLVSKGSIVAEGTIVAGRSLVNKQFTQKNCIIAGIPAKIVKHNIYWKDR